MGEKFKRMVHVGSQVGVKWVSCVRVSTSSTATKGRGGRALVEGRKTGGKRDGWNIIVYGKGKVMRNEGKHGMGECKTIIYF